MRQPRWLRGCAIALAMAGCGSEAEPDTVVTAQEPIVVESPAPVVAETAVTVTPTHGGTVVMAGRYPVEVTPHRSGQVYAYMLGDAPAPAQVQLTVQVPVAGRSTGRPVRLTWNAARRRYEGRVRRVEIVEGPLDVILLVDDVEYRSHVTVFVLLPAIQVVHVEDRRRGKWKHKHKHRRGRVEVRIR